jgi:hypothetical protein
MLILRVGKQCEPERGPPKGLNEKRGSARLMLTFCMIEAGV